MTTLVWPPIKLRRLPEILNIFFESVNETIAPYFKLLIDPGKQLPIDAR